MTLKRYKASDDADLKWQELRAQDAERMICAALSYLPADHPLRDQYNHHRAMVEKFRPTSI